MPYLTPNGPADIRFKCIQPHVCKDEGCAKILGLPGISTRLYNTRALTTSADYIFLAEGEPDAWTFEECGWPSVAVPGADAWKEHHRRMLSGFSKVVLMAHGDEAGRKLAAKVTRALPSVCHVMLLPEGEDANSWYMKHGKEGLKALLNERDDE